jgi:predicted PurR-regulated permease PerM
VGDGPVDALVVVVVVRGVVVVFGMVVVVVVMLGSGPLHKRQYSWPTTRALQFTPAFQRVNWSTLMPQTEAIDWQVSPFSAAHMKEQSRGRMTTAATLVTPKRARVPRKNWMLTMAVVVVMAVMAVMAKHEMSEKAAREGKLHSLRREGNTMRYIRTTPSTHCRPQ